jgi:hypothetical protein
LPASHHGSPGSSQGQVSYGICDGQSGPGAGFLQVLRFHLPSIPLTAAHSSSSIIIWTWYSRPVVASVWPQFHSTPKRKKSCTLVLDGGEELYHLASIPGTSARACPNTHTHTHTKGLVPVSVSSKAGWAGCHGEKRKTSVGGENTRVIKV